MSNAKLDLWPEEITFESNLVTPTTILKEQASILGKKTKNIVEGAVQTNISGSGDFVHTFYLVSPAMSNYKYQLLTVHHTLELYPATIVYGPDSYGFEVGDQSEFINVLKKCFANPKTISIIQTLIAQSGSIRPF